MLGSRTPQATREGTSTATVSARGLQGRWGPALPSTSHRALRISSASEPVPMQPATAPEEEPVPLPRGHTAAALRSRTLTLPTCMQTHLPLLSFTGWEQPPVLSYPVPSMWPV